MRKSLCVVDFSKTSTLKIKFGRTMTVKRKVFHNWWRAKAMLYELTIPKRIPIENRILTKKNYGRANKGIIDRSNLQSS